jgi:DHA3 family macrolide efflux protein-like MFS transporter
LYNRFIFLRERETMKQVVATKDSSGWKTPFFAIWTGQAISLLGSRVAGFALVWWLTDTTGSATVLATATLVAIVPEIALAPIAGAYVDRWDRRLVMMAADGLVALVSLWLVAMFLLDAVQVWHLYAAGFVRAVGGSFHWPAMQASTSLMVPKEQLTRVAGLNQTLNGLLSIAAPPLGALLMALIPMSGVMMVDVSTAFLAIVPLLFVHIPQPRRETATAGEGTARSSIWSDIKEGMRYLWGWPGMITLIGMALIFKLASTPAFTLIPLLVRSHFGGDAAQLSLLQALFGVGVVIGGVILSVWGGFKRKIYTLLMGLIVASLSLVGFGVAPSHAFGMALASSLLLGLVIPMIDGPFMAIMQSTVAPEIQGRVFTLTISLLQLSSPLSLAVAGPISDTVGLQAWYLAAGAFSLVLGAAGFFIPAIVNIEENGHATPEAAASLAAPEGAVEGAAQF